MKKLTRIATPLIAVAMMTVPMMALAQSSQQGNATQSSSTNNDWTTPPAGTAQPQAYKDGIESAKLDKLTKRAIDPTKSHMYVAPPVKKDARDAYRTSFVAGYQVAVSHGTGAQDGQ